AAIPVDLATATGQRPRGVAVDGVADRGAERIDRRLDRGLGGVPSHGELGKTRLARRGRRQGDGCAGDREHRREPVTHVALWDSPYERPLRCPGSHTVPP